MGLLKVKEWVKIIGEFWKNLITLRIYNTKFTKNQDLYIAFTRMVQKQILCQIYLKK